MNVGNTKRRVIAYIVAFVMVFAIFAPIPIFADEVDDTVVIENPVDTDDNTDEVENPVTDETNETNVTDETNETEEVDETEETDEVDETEETDEVDETEETNEVDETEETNEVDETEETDEVDETEETDEVDETEETDEVDETEEIEEPTAPLPPTNDTIDFAPPIYAPADYDFVPFNLPDLTDFLLDWQLSDELSSLALGDDALSIPSLQQSGSPVVVVGSDNSLVVTGRNAGNWNTIDITRPLAVGDLIIIEGNVDVASETVMISERVDPWAQFATVTPDPNGDFVVFFAPLPLIHDLPTGVRFQTSGTSDYTITDIRIYSLDDGSSTPPGEVIPELPDLTDFDLDWDIADELDGIALGATVLNVPSLQGSGSPTAVLGPNNSILVSDREQSHYTIDIARGLDMGDMILITGTATPGATVIFGEVESPWGWLANTTASTSGHFVLSLVATSDLGRFRFQVNNEDDYTITRMQIFTPSEPLDPTTPPATHESLWSLNSILDGIAVGTVVSIRPDDLYIANAGAVLTVAANNSLVVSGRSGVWASLEVRHAIYPTDWIYITGTGTPGATIALQRMPGSLTIGTGLVAADGSFTISVPNVTPAQALDADHLRLNTDTMTDAQPGALDNISVTRFDIYRHPDAEANVTPDVTVPPVDLPPVPIAELGNYVLRVQLPTGNQWDGLRLNRAVFDEFLNPTETYAFEVDIWSPQAIGTSGVGIMVQTDTIWAHLVHTPIFPYNQEERHFTRYGAGFAGATTNNPLNLATHGGWQNIQIVRLGNASGGMNEGSAVLFYIDNFRIRNATGEIVWQHNFENGESAPFTTTAGQIEVVSVDDVGALEIIDPEWDMTLPSLAERFSNYFMLGNIWSTPTLMNDPETQAFFARQFNAVTAENHMKVDHIAPASPSTNPADWTFTTADAFVDWAEANNQAVIGHTLVWHSQARAWQTGRGDNLLTREEAMENMRFHIQQVAGRYAERIYSWDVLNEVFLTSVSEAAWNANPDWRAHLRRQATPNDLGANDPAWYDAFANGATGDEDGGDFVFYAFYFARQYDPHAILYYNDFNEEMIGKREAIAEMVIDINNRWENHPSYDGRLLIEGIGMQSHYHLDQWATNLDLVRPAIQRFIGTGARVSITELDITIGGQGGAQPPTLPAPLTPEQQQRQADAFARVFSYYLEFAEHIHRVSFWGLSDAQSWRAWGHPLLFDGNFRPKLAFDAVYNATANNQGGGGNGGGGGGGGNQTPPPAPGPGRPNPVPPVVTPADQANRSSRVVRPWRTRRVAAEVEVTEDGETAVDEQTYVDIFQVDLTGDEILEIISEGMFLVIEHPPFVVELDAAAMAEWDIQPGDVVVIETRINEALLPDFAALQIVVIVNGVEILVIEGVDIFVDFLDMPEVTIEIEPPTDFEQPADFPAVSDLVVPPVTVTPGVINVATVVEQPFVDATNRQMLPLRLILETAGVSLTWDAVNSVVQINTPQGVVMLPVNQPLPNNLGSVIIIDGRTFVPVEFINDILNINVNWQQADGTIVIE